MWGDCAQCGHGPANTHFWDARKYRHTWCQLCVVCGRRERDHGAYMHHFIACQCPEYREVAA